MPLLTPHPDATSLDALRIGLVLVFAILQAVMAFWPDLRGWQNTISTRSAALSTPVVPVPPTFAIWGLIFLSCGAFGVWQALPANWSDPLLRQVGWAALALFAGNVLWEAWVPRRGLDWMSVAIIVGELILALWLLFAVSQAGVEGWTWWLMAFPFQLFAGWVSAATFVNLSSTMVRPHAGGPVAETGADPRRPSVALALIGAAALLGLVMTILSGAWPYALAVAWALGGIVLANRAHATIAGTAGAGTIALALAVAVSPAAAQTSTTSENIAVLTIATPTLDIAYLERGPSDGPVTILVHGFPDDATGWLPVMDALAERGVRTLAPYLRGFGPTRFRHEDTPRSGQVAALVSDLRDFMDAHGIKRATLVGQDWGARAVQGVAALHPERVERLVTFGGYAISFGEDGPPPPYSVMQTLWYQHLLNMPFAEGIVRGDAEGFSRHLWSIWSPGWDADERDAALASVATSFDNPDFAPIVLSGYSYTGQGYDPALAELEATLAEAPTVTVPTTIIRGAHDPLETPAAFANDAARFTAIEASITWPDAGHFAHREKPEAVVEALSQPE
jgi:pimeloyl-ACP methyl ester carboxylesterase